MTTNRRRSRPPLPWWLDGRESCGLCLQLYVREMETRCHLCDRPTCPMCVTEVAASRLLVCSECSEAGSEPGDPTDDR